MAINTTGHPQFKNEQAYISYFDLSHNSIMLKYNKDIKNEAIWSSYEIENFGSSFTDNPRYCINTKISLYKTTPNNINPYIIVSYISQNSNGIGAMKYFRIRMKDASATSPYDVSSSPITLDISSGRIDGGAPNDPFSNTTTTLNSPNADNRGLFAITNNKRNLYMVYNEYEKNVALGSSNRGRIMFVWKKIPQLEMSHVNNL